MTACRCALSESGELERLCRFMSGDTNRDWCDGHSLPSPPHHCHHPPPHPCIVFDSSLQHNLKITGNMFFYSEIVI